MSYVSHPIACQETSASSELSAVSDVVSRAGGDLTSFLPPTVREYHSKMHSCMSTASRIPTCMCDSEFHTTSSELDDQLAAPPGGNDSLSVELSSYQPKENSSDDKTVHVSRCKSPVMQTHLAHMMGCKTKLIAQSIHQQSVSTQRSLRVRDASIQHMPVTRDCHVQAAGPEMLEVTTQTDGIDGMELSDEEDGCTSSDVSVHQSSAGTVCRPIHYHPGHQRLVWNAEPKVGSLANVNHQPGGGKRIIPQHKLHYRETAKAKVASIAHHHAAGGNIQVFTRKLDYKSAAKSKIGSLDNIDHRPGGGEALIYNERLNFKEIAKSKVGSLDNINHKPKGGDQKIFYQVVARIPKFATSASSMEAVLDGSGSNKGCRSRSLGDMAGTNIQQSPNTERRSKL